MGATEFKARIKKMGLTQAEAARALDVDPAVVWRIYNGLKPTGVMVDRLEAIQPEKWRGKVRMGRPRKQQTA